MTQAKPRETPITELDRVTIRFAGDSGDGMQLTGSRFTDTTAKVGIQWSVAHRTWKWALFQPWPFPESDCPVEW